MDSYELIPPLPESSPSNEPAPVPEEVILTPEADQIRRPGLVRRVIIGLFSLLLVLSMCLGVGGTAALDEFRQYFERREMSAALDEFMIAMSQGDSATAYWMLAEDFQNRVPYHQLDAMLRGDEFVLFSDYESLKLDSISMRTRRNGTLTAILKGDFLYDGNFKGDFTVEMIKENERWRLTSLRIHVPPAKYDTFEGQGV